MLKPAEKFSLAASQLKPLASLSADHVLGSFGYVRLPAHYTRKNLYLLQTVLYGSELFTLTPNLLEELEWCQLWFIRNIFYVPQLKPKQLLLKLSGLSSIESAIAIKKMLFLGRLISGAKMAPVVRSLFESRTECYFDTNIASKGVLPSICETLHKYDLFGYFESCFSNSTFPTYLTWKTIVMRKIHEFEEKAWNDFVCGHPNLQIAQACLENVSRHKFWSISEQHPDLVSRLHIQTRLMGNFGLNGGIPWLCNAVLPMQSGY